MKTKYIMGFTKQQIIEAFFNFAMLINDDNEDKAVNQMFSELNLYKGIPKRDLSAFKISYEVITRPSRLHSEAEK